MLPSLRCKFNACSLHGSRIPRIFLQHTDKYTHTQCLLTDSSVSWGKKKTFQLKGVLTLVRVGIDQSHHSRYRYLTQAPGHICHDAVRMSKPNVLKRKHQAGLKELTRGSDLKSVTYPPKGQCHQSHTRS